MDSPRLAWIILVSFGMATVITTAPVVCFYTLSHQIDKLYATPQIAAIRKWILLLHLSQDDIDCIYPDRSEHAPHHVDDRVLYYDYDNDFYFYSDPEAFAAEWNRRRDLRRERDAYRIARLFRLMMAWKDWVLRRVMALLAPIMALLSTVYDKFWDLVAKIKAARVGRRSRCHCEDSTDLPIMNESTYQELLLGKVLHAQSAGFGLSIVSDSTEVDLVHK